MSDEFVAMLTQRFSHFYFLLVPNFPNGVPTIKEWGVCLPIFRGDCVDYLAQHLINLHECMDQLDIFHEDVHVFFGRRHEKMV